MLLAASLSRCPAMIGRASLARGAAVPVSAVALGPICGAALPCYALPVHRDAPRNRKTAPPGCKGNRLERAQIGRSAPRDSQ
ncbi:hypothetical protein RCKEEF_97 [Rhodobacter phage RcKeef]|nr:hypothetical protein RCKEEF_97 [Rhodobacter phage RcKeef]